MSEEFISSLRKLSIVVDSRNHLDEGGASYEELEITLPKKLDSNIPYVKFVNDFLEKRGAPNSIPRMCFVINDNVRVAEKVAAYLMVLAGDYVDEDGYQDYSVNERTLKYNLRDEKYTGIDKPLDVITALRMRSVAEGDKIFFEGLENGSGIEEKLRVIESVDNHISIVWLKPNMKDNPLVAQYVINKGAGLIWCDALENDYYLELTKKIIKEAGYTVDKDANLAYYLVCLKQKYGESFGEEIIARTIDVCVNDKVDKKLTRKDLYRDDINERSAWDELEKMIGMDEVKQVVEKMCAVNHEMSRNKLLENRGNNFIFTGEPGSGKTTAAKLVAKVCAEEGVGNGSFVVAARSDLIGKYVGHTAPLVEKCFENASGGVLFVDEADFLVGTKDQFARECIKELVRFMEERKDVIVIFAIYESKLQEFLDLDVGLSSRINKIVRFKNYSVEELIDIAHYMAEKCGYKLEEGSDELIKDYVNKKLRRKNFGNARDIRKLVQTSIDELAMRHQRTKIKSEICLVIRQDDIRKAVISLESEAKANAKAFGFARALVKEDNNYQQV